MAAPRRSLLHAFGVCILQPLVPGATLALFRRYIIDGDELARSIPAWVLVAITLTGASAVALVVRGLILEAGRLKPADIGWRRERPGRAIALGLLGAAAATASLLLAAGAFGADLGEGLHQMLHYSVSQRILFASVGLSLALAEESAFRGFLQPQLVQRMGLPAGYALTAVFFACWHFPLFHVDSMLARFGQGLVFGALRGRDRSLVTPVIAHATYWAFVGLW